MSTVYHVQINKSNVKYRIFVSPDGYEPTRPFYAWTLNGAKRKAFKQAKKFQKKLTSKRIYYALELNGEIKPQKKGRESDVL